MNGHDAFDAARRRYNAAHGIPDTGERCAAVIPLPPYCRCDDIPGHDGGHHAHIGLTVVHWSDLIYDLIRTDKATD